MILGSAVLLLVQKATGDPLGSFGGLIVPLQDQWWRFLTAPFAYVDVGYLFVVAVALAIFAHRPRAAPRHAADGAAAGRLRLARDARRQRHRQRPGRIEVIAGGNGMALGAVAAWFTIRRAETQGAIDQEYDLIGVAVAAAVLLALPIFDSDRQRLRRPGRRRGRRPRRPRRRRPSRLSTRPPTTLGA